MAELEQVHSCTLDQRLAGFPLTHASSTGAVARTQQDIAGHIGTTREVAARIMARMAAQGWIDTRRGEVKILQPTRLAAQMKGE